MDLLYGQQIHNRSTANRTEGVRAVTDTPRDDLRHDQRVANEDGCWVWQSYVSRTKLTTLATVSVPQLKAERWQCSASGIRFGHSLMHQRTLDLHKNKIRIPHEPTFQNISYALMYLIKRLCLKPINCTITGIDEEGQSTIYRYNDAHTHSSIRATSIKL